MPRRREFLFFYAPHERLRRRSTSPPCQEENLVPSARCRKSAPSGWAGDRNSATTRAAGRPAPRKFSCRCFRSSVKSWRRQRRAVRRGGGEKEEVASGKWEARSHSPIPTPHCVCCRLRAAAGSALGGRTSRSRRLHGRRRRRRRGGVECVDVTATELAAGTGRPGCRWRETNMATGERIWPGNWWQRKTTGYRRGFAGRSI